MRLALIALLVTTPAYADDLAQPFRTKEGWDYETVNGESLAKLRPMKKARVRCRVDRLDEIENISIKVRLKCGAKTFAFAFDDAASDLALPRTKPAQTQRLRVQGHEYDVWIVEYGTRAIGFMPGTGPVLLCDSIKPYRCLRLAPLTKTQTTRLENMSKADMDRFADVLTGEGEAPTNDMSKRRPGSGLGGGNKGSISDVKTDGLNVGGGGAISGGGRQGQAARVQTGVGTATTKPSEATPPPRITMGTSSSTTVTSLTPDVATQKIQSAYMAGLKRCYRDALKKHATLKGNLEITLVVNDTGRATATVKTPAADLTACVESQVSSWRFPIPKDGGGDATTATIQLSFTLTPD